MSQDMNPEVIDPTTTDAGSTKRAQCANLWSVKPLKKILHPREPFGSWISLVLCVISISVDPLFFYLPVITDRGCFGLDYALGIIAFVLRSAIDLFYVIYRYFQPQTGNVDSAPRHRLFGRDISYRSPKGYMEFLAVLPLPQVVIIIFVLEMEILDYYNAMDVLKYFVYFQFVPRVIRIYPLVKKATGAFDILGEVSWAKAAFNLYLYLLSGHVFGALWYFFAYQRDICSRAVDKSCDYYSEALYSYQQKFCYDEITKKEFGIYKEVLESGVMKKSFLPRLIYCFRWGMQNLSCFGENLETSPDSWENIFAIMITIVSLVLFVFFIGNMQFYLQSSTIRSEDMKRKMRDLQQWTSSKNLDENIQKQIHKYQQNVLRAKGADIENLISTLPTGIRRNVKRNLGIELLKKVPLFGGLCKQHLNAMCERLEHVLYPDKTCIVRAGDDPVTEMLFIMHDKSLIYTVSSNDRDKNVVSTHYHRAYCGDELIPWALDPESSSDLPISTKTICTDTEVEAFALRADDLKDVFKKFRRCYPMRPLPYNCTHSTLKHWAASVIQAAWRHYREKHRNEDHEIRLKMHHG